MQRYLINKGIGKPAEFQGLKSQYLFLFAGGLLGIFVFYIIIYMIGISQVICISTCVILAIALVWGTFAANHKYGEHGLMKRMARRSHPRYIINRVPFPSLFKRQN